MKQFAAVAAAAVVVAAAVIVVAVVVVVVAVAVVAADAVVVAAAADVVAVAVAAVIGEGLHLAWGLFPLVSEKAAVAGILGLMLIASARLGAAGLPP